MEKKQETEVVRLKRKQISKSKFRKLWGRLYKQAIKKNNRLLPADAVTLAYSKTIKRYRVRR